MGKTNRALSVLLAVLMVLTAFPLSLPGKEMDSIDFFKLFLQLIRLRRRHLVFQLIQIVSDNFQAGFFTSVPHRDLEVRAA